MTAPGTRKTPIWLIVTLAVIAVAVAAGAVAAGVMESGKKSPVAAVTTSTPKNAPTTTRTPTSTATPAPTKAAAATPAPRPAVAPSSAPPIVPEPEPPPVQPAAPTPAQRQCPTGPVTANLTSVDIVKGASPPPGYGLTEITVTARGTLVNGSTAAIRVGEKDIPNFLGLDDRGQSVVIELYGTFDWTPPPGQPSMGEFSLNPGESVNYTAVSKAWDHTVAEVKYWYSANVSGSLLLYFPSNVRCPVPVMQPAEGKAIQNTFTG